METVYETPLVINGDGLWDSTSFEIETVHGTSLVI